MNSFNDKPLRGKTIVLTRSVEQNREAHSYINRLGGTVLELPALIIGPPSSWRPLDEALSDLKNFDWIIFSSVNGVKALENRLKEQGTTLAKKPKGLKIAAVGKKTGLHLDSLGISVDFIPPEFVADSLIKNFPSPCLGLKVLLPRVESGGRTLLADAFSSAGVDVVEVAAYESQCPQSIPGETLKALANKRIDIIAFCSSKTVSHTAKLLKISFGENWQSTLNQSKIISIGPQTTLSCIKYFKRVDEESYPHDIEGLINSCINSSNQKNI